MSPNTILMAIGCVLNAFLLTYRQKYPPVAQQVSKYRYGMLTQSSPDISPVELRETISRAQAANSVFLESAELKCLTKTIGLLLYQAVPKDDLRRYSGSIGIALTSVKQILSEWLAARSVGLIGHYYADRGLEYELTEELPDVNAMLTDIRNAVFEHRIVDVRPGIFVSNGSPDRVTFDPSRMDMWVLKDAGITEIELELDFFSATADDVGTFEMPVLGFARNTILGWAEGAVSMRVANKQFEEN